MPASPATAVTAPWVAAGLAVGVAGGVSAMVPVAEPVLGADVDPVSGGCSFVVGFSSEVAVDVVLASRSFVGSWSFAGSSSFAGSLFLVGFAAFAGSAVDFVGVECEPRLDLVIVTVTTGLEVSVSILVGAPASCVAEPVVWPGEESVGDDVPDSEDDDDADDDDSVGPPCPVESAEATPHPNPTATPIPRAAAKPPIRPTCADAPMCRLTPIVCR
ncbi:hypothetical protein [Mycobacterium yunnanensis]|uniref:hypothetical protein n=1 Tax=Mycobacterium yunnanensis TaxID=368477 RepID=UPI0021F38244|nr:hypothetical protein [Mycobacterium yunnanensis]